MSITDADLWYFLVNWGEQRCQEQIARLTAERDELLAACHAFYRLIDPACLLQGNQLDAYREVEKVILKNPQEVSDE